MEPILIFRHIACEGPGYLAEVLDRHRLAYRIIAIDAGDPVPADPGDAPALVFMGGPMSVNDPLPWIQQELALIRAAHGRGLPVLGHCLGGQLISKALGGTVGPNRVREIGWHDVETATGHEPWPTALPARFPAFHWHGETFTLPAGAVPLLRNEWCEHQGFTLGNTLALQCHVEITAPMVREWADLYADELATPSPSIQSVAAMTTDLEARVTALHTAADALYARWLQPLLAT